MQFEVRLQQFQGVTTNQEMMIQTRVDAQCEFGPNALLPMRVRRALSVMDTENVRLELLDNSVQISGGGARITLHTDDPRLYLEPPRVVIDQEHVAIAPTLFRRAVRTTSFATRRFFKTNRLTLQCVNIVVSDSKMIFTSTDGTRVAQFVAEVDCHDFECADGGLLIQPHILTRLSRLTRNSTIKMCIKDGTHAVFGLSDKTYAAVALVPGSFPKMDAVFATFDRDVDHYQTVKLKTADLAAVLSQTAVMSTQDHQVVRLSVADQRLWSEMRTPEIGEARCGIDVASWVNQSPVTLDVQLLRDGIAVLYHNERVWLSIPDKALPLKLSTDNFTYVVMPFSDNTQQRHAYRDAIATIQRIGVKSSKATT